MSMEQLLEMRRVCVAPTRGGGGGQEATEAERARERARERERDKIDVSIKGLETKLSGLSLQQIDQERDRKQRAEEERQKRLESPSACVPLTHV